MEQPLSKDPQQRYQSARDLAEALGAWLEDRPQRGDRWPTRLRLWCWRHRVIVTLLVAAALVLGLVVREAFEALQEPARAQAILAHQQAKTLQLRLSQLSGAVTKTVTQPRLGALLRENDTKGLQQFIARTGDERVDLNGQSPFVNWLILNRDGRIVARWPVPDERLEAIPLGTRDYFDGALRLANQEGGSPVHISKVYQSVLPEDKRHKFCVSAAVRHQGEIVGVLVATVTTGPDMGLAGLKDGDSVTALLAQRDPSFVPGEHAPPASASAYLVLLHPAYQPGDQPVWLPKVVLPEVEAGVTEEYRDPVAAVNDEYGGRWLAAFAPVEGTPFIVVAQRPAPTLPVRLWLVLGAALLGCALLVAVADRWRRSRKSRASSAAGSTSGAGVARP